AFTPVPSVVAKPPRAAGATVAFGGGTKQMVRLGAVGGAPAVVVWALILAPVADSLFNKAGTSARLKTDWVAGMGGDWYCRASGAAVLEVAKPNTLLGVGVDAVHEFIRADPRFTGNDLGRFGNIERLPSLQDVAAFRLNNPDANY